MPVAASLIQAVLVEYGLSSQAAHDLLDRAFERDTDPLIYCALISGLSTTVVMQRAAAWAGFAFYQYVPRHMMGTLQPTRLEMLADIKLFRVQVVDREVACVAPNFLDVLRLKGAADAKPHLRHVLWFVPDHAMREYLAAAAQNRLTDEARQRLARRWPFASAQLELTRLVRFAFLVALLSAIGLLLLWPYFGQAWLLPLAVFAMVLPAGIRIAAVMTPARPHAKLVRPPDDQLPMYSVLIPLRNEATMVPQLFATMEGMDYPPDRLDIKFVVEYRSYDTVYAVRKRLGDPRFSIVVVPDSAPRTKPKAISYALPLCRGEHVVVFDAEDVPDVDQLWKAALRFRNEPDMMCLQARLVIDNGQQNRLTSLFAGEYAALFAVLLPALAQWRMPMPLGGTSNHFRVKELLELGGWDAFNVTEDADLGIRLARSHMRVDTLDTATHEPASGRYKSWLGQRTRWMKGWMQTYIVHTRNPKRLLDDLGWTAFLGFQVLVLSMITAPLLHVGFGFVLIERLISGAFEDINPAWTLLYVMIIAFGYGSAWLMTVVGLKRVGLMRLALRQFWLPAYWFLMGIATLRAAYELLLKPYYWFKSPHLPALARHAVKRAKIKYR
jgi:cellulose synthase/poly-beta-1,6-N-acetylglucosamine synthase-like glycosyltransferase